MTVDPPIAISERPITLTLRKDDLDVRTIGAQVVHIENKGDSFVPLFFYVGLREQPPLANTLVLGFFRALLKGPTE